MHPFYTANTHALPSPRFAAVAPASSPYVTPATISASSSQSSAHPQQKTASRTSTSISPGASPRVHTVTTTLPSPRTQQTVQSVQAFQSTQHQKIDPRKPGSTTQIPPKAPLKSADATRSQEAKDTEHSADGSLPQMHSTTNSNVAESDRSGDSTDEKPGFVGPWKLGKSLGEGGFGQVLIATHTKTNESAAVKIFSIPQNKAPKGSKDASGQPENQNRFYREIDALQALPPHPNVIRILQVVNHASKISLVLELATEGDLLDYTCARGCLTETEARVYFRQIVEGISHCHTHRMVHRDLKLENILIFPNRVAKIADFGLSATLSSENANLRTLCGSPTYHAPEMLLGCPYNYPVDVWALGVMLYAMISGSFPFDNPSHAVLCQQILHGTYPPIRNASHDARDLIARLLQQDPVRRIKIPDIKAHCWYTEQQAIVPANSSPRQAPKSPVNTSYQSSQQRTTSSSSNRGSITKDENDAETKSSSIVLHPSKVPASTPTEEENLLEELVSSTQSMDDFDLLDEKDESPAALRRLEAKFEKLVKIFDSDKKKRTLESEASQNRMRMMESELRTLREMVNPDAMTKSIEHSNAAQLMEIARWRKDVDRDRKHLADAFDRSSISVSGIERVVQKAQHDLSVLHLWKESQQREQATLRSDLNQVHHKVIDMSSKNQGIQNQASKHNQDMQLPASPDLDELLRWKTETDIAFIALQKQVESIRINMEDMSREWMDEVMLLKEAKVDNKQFTSWREQIENDIQSTNLHSDMLYTTLQSVQKDIVELQKVPPREYISVFENLLETGTTEFVQNTQDIRAKLNQLQRDLDNSKKEQLKLSTGMIQLRSLYISEGKKSATTQQLATTEEGIRTITEQMQGLLTWKETITPLVNRIQIEKEPVHSQPSPSHPTKEIDDWNERLLKQNIAMVDQFETEWKQLLGSIKPDKTLSPQVLKKAEVQKALPQTNVPTLAQLQTIIDSQATRISLIEENMKVFWSLKASNMKRRQEIDELKRSLEMNVVKSRTSFEDFKKKQRSEVEELRSRLDMEMKMLRGFINARRDFSMLPSNAQQADFEDDSDQSNESQTALDEATVVL
eukprot:TRINITY_DN10047_c0_g1_i2.p1 TRINITY_DN10047_c0_g1~~TRINITY_DN10047_c0_g1_i2.p1  ORF type:complete len:1085 (-),score=195.44 TRINITY_DN10047_c0_g1_i2:237-3491(-)